MIWQRKLFAGRNDLDEIAEVGPGPFTKDAVAGGDADDGLMPIGRY